MIKKMRTFALLATTVAALFLYVGQDLAEAARLGGSKSFGSKPSYQRSTPAPTPSPTSPQMSQTQPSAQRPMATPSASPMGRWGGIWGGVLMGGLIGSLLFGGAHAYGGPGLFDILLIGGGLFLLYRFIRARRMTAESPVAVTGPLSFEGRPAQSWSEPGYTPAPETTPVAAEKPAFSLGFDSEDFLKGAKAIYTRLQASWDKRDMADIAQFVSPEVLAEINKQAQADTHPGKTELLMVNPRIVEVREVENQTIVSVLYDVMMREAATEMAKQVREVWHFSREVRKPEAFWLLEGIQQVE